MAEREEGEQSIAVIIGGYFLCVLWAREDSNLIKRKERGKRRLMGQSQTVTKQSLGLFWVSCAACRAYPSCSLVLPCWWTAKVVMEPEGKDVLACKGDNVSFCMIPLCFTESPAEFPQWLVPSLLFPISMTLLLPLY